MKHSILNNAVMNAWQEKRRLVVPLLGFPGLTLTGSTIKLTQQNYGEHFKLVKSLAEKFTPDVLFPLMDLSVEANALGRFTIFPIEESPSVPKDKLESEDLEKISCINVAYDTRLLGYVETMKLMKSSLQPGILRGAYITGPYTLAALVMGAEEAAIATITDAEFLHSVLKIMTDKISDYVNLLLTAGAEIICMLDPSAVMLGPDEFDTFSVFYSRRIIEICESRDASVVYHICGNTNHLIEKMSASGVDALSLDSRETGVRLDEVVKRIPADVVIIGNLSPVGSILYGTPEEVEDETMELLRSMKKYPNFILSTGCDLPQETPLENIEAFLKTGREYLSRN